MMKTTLFLTVGKSAFLLLMACGSMILGHVQASTWNPTSSVDDYERAENWDPVGVPGLMDIIRVEQLGSRNLTPIRINENHENSALQVFDAHALLNLQGNSLYLAQINWEPRFASIVVGGARSAEGSPGTLEVFNGTLSAHHAIVGKGRPSEFGPLQNNRPAMVIQSSGAMALTQGLGAGYYDPETGRDRPGVVHIGGVVSCDLAQVFFDSKLAVLNGGFLYVEDLLDNTSSGEFYIGNSSSTGYPQSVVDAGRAYLSGTTTLEHGVLSVDGTLWANWGSTVSVSNDSRLESATAFILGNYSGSSVAHVTVNGNDSQWLSSNSIYVGGMDTMASGGGKLSISDQGMVNAGTLLKIWPAGVVELDDGLLSAQTIELEGSICGTGTITGNVFNNGGTISPGCSIGNLQVAGNYTQAPSGKLEIEVHGASEGQFDVMHIDGQASLAGTLQIKLAEGFVPDPTKTFPVVNANTVSGAFDTIQVDGDAEVELIKDGGQLKMKLKPPQDQSGLSISEILAMLILGLIALLLGL